MNHQTSYVLPTLPGKADTLARHFHTTFMHEFKGATSKDICFRIFTAIQKTATQTGQTPETVAQSLVDSGLRASKGAFPNTYVTRLEKTKMQPQWNLKAGSEGQRALLTYWAKPLVIDYKRVLREPQKHC
jgi:hypothetical protein